MFPVKCADCKQVTGTVPDTLASGLHDVTVHAGDPATNLPIFDALQYTVS